MSRAEAAVNELVRSDAVRVVSLSMADMILRKHFDAAVAEVERLKADAEALVRVLQDIEYDTQITRRAKHGCVCGVVSQSAAQAIEAYHAKHGVPRNAAGQWQKLSDGLPTKPSDRPVLLYHPNNGPIKTMGFPFVVTNRSYARLLAIKGGFTHWMEIPSCEGEDES